MAGSSQSGPIPDSSAPGNNVSKYTLSILSLDFSLCSGTGAWCQPAGSAGQGCKFGEVVLPPSEVKTEVFLRESASAARNLLSEFSLSETVFE